MNFNVWTLPNAISSYRLFAGPACLYFLTADLHNGLWFALAIMIMAEISDFLDGFLARQFHMVSRVGKVLDPMADRLYRVSVFIGFAAMGWMPVWMLLIILSRDIIVSYLRIIAEQRLTTLSARQSGKIKAVVQSAAQLTVVVMFAIWGPDHAGLHEVAFGVLLLATLMTAYSLVDYAMSVVFKLD